MTLVEILVAISVIAVLIALAVPAVMAGREASRRSRCANNLRQIGLALQSYAGQYGTFPPGYSGPANGFSFLVALLPYIEQTPLYASLNMAGPSVSNATLATVRLDAYLCPSDEGHSARAGGMAATNYAGNRGSGTQAYGDNGLFGLVGAVTPAQVTDGLSNTAAASEWLVGPFPITPDTRDADRTVFDTPKALTAPGELDAFAAACQGLDPATAAVSPAEVGVPWRHGEYGHSLYNHIVPVGGRSCLNSHAWQLGAWTAKSRHRGGAMLLLADGHARFTPATVAAPVWRAIGSRAGGELIPDGGP